MPYHTYWEWITILNVFKIFFLFVKYNDNKSEVTESFSFNSDINS